MLGHIRSYANFLDLNSTVIIEEFKLQNSYEKIDIKDQIPKPINYNNFNIRVFLSFASIIFIFVTFYYLFIDGEFPSPEYALVPDIPVNLEPIVEKTIVTEHLNKQIDNFNFYDLDEDGEADTLDLKLVDGGYGDKDGIVNGVVVDPSTAGIVSFVGLVCPHIARILVGNDHRLRIPAAALLGAILVSFADLIARIIIAPSELPMGIITAGIGAPFLLYLVRYRI